MENKKTFFMIFIVMILSCGKLTCAMQQDRHMANDLKQDEIFQQARSSARSLGKQCLRDILKMTIGTSIFLSSVWGMYGLKDCATYGDFQKPVGKFMCSNPIQINTMVCAGASGSYTIYQIGKLLHDSWQLAKIMSRKPLEKQS